MARRVAFPKENCVELEDFAPGAPGAGEVRIRTAYSLVSPGTEGTVLHKLFDEGTHWAKYARFPFLPGYAAVCVVDELGANVGDFTVGDRVVARVGHASEHVVPASQCTRIPDEVQMVQACWFALAKIALMGARAARYELGDSVAVVGAGPIGQMSVRWAFATGARHIVAVDRRGAQRLELARKGGASHAVVAQLDEAYDEVVSSCGGEQPRVVVDTTGRAQVLAEALRLPRDHGGVVLLGDTGSPASQHLTSDVVFRGVRIAGVHDDHSRSGRGGQDADCGLHELFFQLVRTGRFNVDDLNTHYFSPAECEQAYQLADRRQADTLGIVFDWTAGSRLVNDLKPEK